MAARSALAFSRIFSLLSSIQANDEVVDQSRFDAIHDTEAFVAVNDGAIVVVFRGSGGGSDWLTNFSVLPRDVPKDWKLETTEGDLHRVRLWLSTRDTRYRDNLRGLLSGRRTDVCGWW